MFLCNLCQKRNHSLVRSLRTRVLHSGILAIRLLTSQGYTLPKIWSKVIPSRSQSLDDPYCAGALVLELLLLGVPLSHEIYGKLGSEDIPFSPTASTTDTSCIYAIHTSDLSWPKCAPAIANFLKAFADQSLAVVEVPKGHRRGIRSLSF